MMTQPLLDTLRHLKLTGMHDALAHQLTQPDTYDLPFEDRLPPSPRLGAGPHGTTDER